MSRVASTVIPAVCGLATTLSSDSSGCCGSGGSSWNTSMPAPAIVPLTSASYSAASSCTGPRAVVMKNAVGFIRANCSRPMRPSVSGVSGQFRCTKSERSSSSSSSTFVAPARRGLVLDEVGVVGEHRHRERRAQLDEPTTDLPDADDPERLAQQLAAAQRHAVLHDLAPDHAIGQRDLLRQREHEPERVLGHRLAAGTGVVAHDHPGGGARVDVDDVVARARPSTPRAGRGTAASSAGPQIHCSATPGLRASSVRMSDW